MSMKLFASLSLAVWLLTATSTLSQSNNRYVMDTHGDPLESDEEYFIRPAITDNGGRFTLINRNQSCPLHVGLENTDLPQGYPVRFTPFAQNHDDDEVRVNSDLKVEFVEVSSTCVQSTAWKLGENDTSIGRRVIVTGRDDGTHSAGNYFRIEETQNASIYNIRWCPTEVCPTCRFICAKLKLLLLPFLFYTILLCFFHCTLSLINPQDDLSWIAMESEDINMVQTRRDSWKKCDFSVGKWVFDQSYPLYDSNCPYLSTAVTCQKNGRPDSDYEKWKWKPNGCSIPRFDALGFLGKMRSKRIMLVGDSIMRNQWESLVCLVQQVIPTDRKKVTYNGPSMAFHAMDFETSIEFFWAPLLVELKKESNSKRILHLDLIEDNARYWRGVDILVFDSAHWWTHSGQTSSWDYYMEGNSIITNMNPMVAYQKGLSTWARWVDLNLNPRKTRIIFRSMSPRHNRQNGWKCYKQRQPVQFFSHLHVPEPLVVLQGVIKRMRFPVYLQDITTMTAFRRDGHPSVYSKAVNEERQKAGTGLSSDCSHWCLPGVPDIWNEMLSALL